MNYSVCIDALFFESSVPIKQQIQTVKEQGFSSIEFWTWWDKDISALKSACLEQGISVQCFCTRFISLLDKEEESAYLEGFKETLSLAKDLSCSKIITQVGNTLPNVPRDIQLQQAVSTLKKAGDMASVAGCTLLVEPLNIRVDHKGYFLSTTDDAIELMKLVDHDNVKLLFDIYHQQITEGDILRHIQESAEYIGHLHIADNPGRDRPGSGEINYTFLIPELYKVVASDVYMGLEYFTQIPVEDSLSLTAAFLPGVDK